MSVNIDIAGKSWAAVKAAAEASPGNAASQYVLTAKRKELPRGEQYRVTIDDVHIPALRVIIVEASRMKPPILDSQGRRVLGRVMKRLTAEREPRPTVENNPKDLSETTRGGENGRDTNGQFMPGHTLATGKRLEGRFNLVALARRKSALLGLDLDDLLWGVIQAMFVQAKQGDTKAAKIICDMLGEKEAKGPIVAIDMSGRLPQMPAVEDGPDGAPNLRDHFSLLVKIGKERGLLDLSDLLPADVIATSAAGSAEDLPS